MPRHRLWYRFAALGVATLLAVGAGASPAGGQAPDDKDALIARQQSLIAEQQTLITAQESLLNVYRCRFGIDTQLVPNGCPDQSQPTPSPTAAPTPASTSTASPAPTPTPTPEDQTGDPAIPSGTTAQQWEQLRQCTTNGNYQFSHANGINFGAYEFRQSTWNDLASRHHPHLAGVNPRNAAPADQDRMAYRLYEERGWRPWPVCAASLSLPTPGDNTSTDSTELPPLPEGTTQEQWDYLIRCESRGNYRAYNPAGPYLGAFQFNQSTWNGVASRHYPHLDGLDPRDASPADQHRMAYALHGERGWQPWPTCGAPFRQ